MSAPIKTSSIIVLFAFLLCSWVTFESQAEPRERLYRQRYADEVGVTTLLTLAQQGDARASYLLGTRYASGRGGIRDDSEALRWFKQAAEQGLAEAQYNLGIMYSTGRGTAIDMQQAAGWYRLAAEQGLMMAQFNLGSLLATGTGVELDDVEAAKWLLKAAEQGLAEAQHNIGLLYEYGQGVRRDLEQALHWYRKAEEQGVQEARSRAAKLAKLFPDKKAEKPVTPEPKTVPATAAVAEPKSPPQQQPEKSEDSSPKAMQPMLAQGKMDLQWLQAQSPNHYTVQLISGVQIKGARHFVTKHRLQGQSRYIPRTNKNRTTYTVVYGSYPNQRMAKSAINNLPQTVQKNGTWARRFNSLTETLTK